MSRAASAGARTPTPRSTDAELVQHAAQPEQIYRCPLFAQRLHHRVLLLDSLAGASDDLIDLGGGDHHDAAVVGDDQVARPDDDAATGDRLAQQAAALLDGSLDGDGAAEDREAG